MTKYLMTKDNGFFHFTPHKKYEVIKEEKDRYIITNDQKEEVAISVNNKWWELCDEGAPKTWGEMTGAEKGALLLAHHEGKVIQTADFVGRWQFTDLPNPLFDSPDLAYRVKPEPLVGKVVLIANYLPDSPIYFDNNMSNPTHSLTLPTLDGDLVTGEFANEDGMKVVIEEKK